MSARERCETGYLGPGLWLVEGWTAERQPDRTWRASNDRGGVIVAPTLEGICEQVLTETG